MGALRGATTRLKTPLSRMSYSPASHTREFGGIPFTPSSSSSSSVKIFFGPFSSERMTFSSMSDLCTFLDKGTAGGPPNNFACSNFASGLSNMVGIRRAP